MSRRRKRGDGLGPKEECSSAGAGSGKRRPGSARGSRLCRVEEGPAPPGQRHERPPAAASCPKSNPEEKYETPKRMQKMDLLPSTFSSPNDPDGLSDIFWDQNSPMTKQLGKGRKKQIYTTDSDEISHIVNCIAPQDEKPVTDSMLGVWIGETAIPCTPSVAKGKSRAKYSCTKSKTQNHEEELMKLAKEFDKNMEELDVIQEQNERNCDFTQMISETSNDYKDNVPIPSLCHILPEIDSAVIEKPVKEFTQKSKEYNQNSSHKLFDQNIEAALNAIFDGSTQKCSGQLSQDRSDAVLSITNTTFGKKSTLKEETVITSETVNAVQLQKKTYGSLSFGADTPIMTKSCVTPCSKEMETFNKLLDPFATSGMEEDWENFLRNEPFVMPTVETPELLPVPNTAHDAAHKDIYTFNSKNHKRNSRTDTCLDVRLSNSNSLQGLPSKITNRKFIDDENPKKMPSPNEKPKQLSTGNKVKLERACNKMTIGDKIQGCALASSSVTKIKEGIYTKVTPVNASGKKAALNTGYFNEQKSKPISSQSFKTSANPDLYGPVTSASETKSDSKLNQTNAPNLTSFLDDWNDPSFANEIIKSCHILENTWETDDVDDDLLYQACDDIERLSQQQDIGNESKSENTTEMNESSKYGAKNTFTPSKGSHFVQSKHWNLDSVTVQTSSSGNSSQMDKSMKMEKGESCRSSPSNLSATTKLAMYSKNSDDEIKSPHVHWNNTDIPVRVNRSTFALAGSSHLNVSSSHISTGIPTTNKLISHRTVKNETLTDHNKTTKFSKYTFTKLKRSQTHSQFNKNCTVRSTSDTKIIQSLEENKTPPINPLHEVIQQQSFTKFSESGKQPSKEEEEKNRKYSPEEIQKKRQEALVRRMARARATSLNAAST
ncbi:ewing's tumor-associated antigen 1 [Echinops telfairi]|uniref:Ewing's tumor-associated antigen 1 n=1 Tax=Echinops telfairi TaxID=9371 RepID=A0ABM0IXU9_ECHTE|nr:ewing's tumor-associated antigen 1 [Echinops telfairi]